MALLDSPETELHRKGLELRQQGSMEEGNKLIRQAAEAGAPNALGSLIWLQVKNDNLKDAIKDFNDCLPQVHKWVKTENERLAKSWRATSSDRKHFSNFCATQISNSKSNVAIAYLGIGEETKAMELWSEAATDHGHIEARFYPIFHMCQVNPTMAIGILKSSFTKQELQKLMKDMVEVSSEGTGWFADWAKSSLNLLRQTVHKSSMGIGGATATAGAATFIAAKGMRNMMNDQIDEAMGDGEGPMDWLQDLF